MLRGLGSAGRRHLAPLQFAYDLLEDFGVGGYGACGKLAEEEVACANGGVVATKAVVLNSRPLRFGILRDLIRGLRDRLSSDAWFILQGIEAELAAVKSQPAPV